MYEQPHSRCKAHKRNGQPCTMYRMNGQLVCRMHGGKNKASLETGKRRVALAAAQSMSSRIVAYDLDFDESPEEGLMREVKWSAQIAIALGEACASIQDEHLLTWSGAQGQQLNDLMKAHAAERDRHAKFCKMALDAGIQQRQIDIIESQAGQLVSAMLALLMNPRLGLSSEQIIEGRVIAADTLRTLALDKNAIDI